MNERQTPASFQSRNLRRRLLQLLPGSRSVRWLSRPYRYTVPLLAALAVLAVPSVASASVATTEQVAAARWSTPFQCPDGSAASAGRLIVESVNSFDAGTTPNPNPPITVTFAGQCADGAFSWGVGSSLPTQAPTTRFDPDLEYVSVSGSYANVRDNRGGLHTVSINVHWTATGPVVIEDSGPGSSLTQRSATATATVVFDGDTLVDGAANHPSHLPFIRVEVCA
ncbi:hypothetical protein KBX50_31135 [Micromonospora sp. C51]|uniref:hypothetical protein n=1 Tax=Micromonospora sp. C51 TaxID=2824879 RepID=UPI001B38F865|nr:hypothetical protein [Micromonospora sp. C51]MBQ1052892.1 hypothetical protein [Micromonospora sp. C51]